MPATIIKDKADMALLAEMVQDGSTRREVAGQFACSETAVKSAMKRWNLTHPARPLRFHRTSLIDVSLRERVLLLVAQGCDNCGEVARRMGRDASLVHRWMHALVASGALKRFGTGKGTRLAVITVRLHDTVLGGQDDDQQEPWDPCWSRQHSAQAKKPPQARCQKVLRRKR